MSNFKLYKSKRNGNIIIGHGDKSDSYGRANGVCIECVCEGDSYSRSTINGYGSGWALARFREYYDEIDIIVDNDKYIIDPLNKKIYFRNIYTDDNSLGYGEGYGDYTEVDFSKREFNPHVTTKYILNLVESGISKIGYKIKLKKKYGI